MPTYWSPTEKALRRLDSLARAGHTEKAVKVAVDLVVRHKQTSGLMARRAGVTVQRLRKAIFADPDVVARMNKAEADARALDGSAPAEDAASRTGVPSSGPEPSD
jgi:hypothetical protein